MTSVKKMQAMTHMSRVIRETSLQYAPKITELPDDILDGLVEIVGAYYEDFKGEREQRDERGDERFD
jgi:hypothetical protein